VPQWPSPGSTPSPAWRAWINRSAVRGGGSLLPHGSRALLSFPRNLRCTTTGVGLTRAEQPPYLSEAWNDSCALRPATTRVASTTLPPSYVQFNIAVIVIEATMMVLGMAAYLWERQRSTYIRKRPLELLVVTGIANTMFIVIGPVRELTQVTFPCPLVTWGTVVAVTLILAPLAVRMMSFRYTLYWSKMANMLTVQVLNTAMGDDPTALAAPSLRKSIYRSAQRQHRVAAPAMKSPDAGDAGASASAADNAADDGKSDAHDSGSVVSSSKRGGAANDQFSEYSLGTSRTRLSAHAITSAAFRSSALYNVGTVCLISLPAFIIGAGLQAGQPWLKAYNCVGCVPDLEMLLIMFSYGSFIIVLLQYNVYLNRNAKDPLGLRREITLGVLPAIPAGAVGVLLYLVEPYDGHLMDNGLAPAGALVVLGSGVIFFVMCPLQVYISYRLRSSPITMSTKDFLVILNDTHGLELFRRHCVNEFTVESIKFWMQVRAFKAAHPTLSAERRGKLAKSIFNYFIAPSAIFEVNIRSDVREDIRHVFGSEDAAPPPDAPVDVFDRASDEILDLMRRDTFERFIKTTEYQAWADKNVLPTRDGHIELVPHAGPPLDEIGRVESASALRS